ncbi:MAG: hypothetical protein ING66_15825 [Rhodocyclaceae bacterium]|nr:hypothetical protein [Rhodocyclaceae bacterium]MCA3060361.1 hypothetical protein [Rhodocyclaceae bacterium]MCA3082538.1 hypothetical protein [Rhodocyclaceae bacterium]
MKLIIGEYLRTLRERDELDRLLPDLLVEMGYVPIARPQTGNRQYGVDLAVRGSNPKTGADELLLLVIKQNDIGRSEWDGGTNSVRQSISEIFDAYLRSHVSPEDEGRPVRIVVVTNGELKQTVQASWSGFVHENKERAAIEFWGADHLSELIEQHLMDEHLFLDLDRKQLRRALALSGDGDYDRRDLDELFLRTLGLTHDGKLVAEPKSEKLLAKSMRVVNLSAQMFASWSAKDGDGRQGLRAVERALLWSWHRIQLVESSQRGTLIADAFSDIWLGYLVAAKRYFEKIQGHLHTPDGISGYHSDAAEFSFVAFEQVGIVSSIGLALLLFLSNDDEVTKVNEEGAVIVANGLAELVANNGICSSPCLDRHSNDVSLALTLMHALGLTDRAKTWLATLIRNVDYAYKRKRFVPIATDSIEELAESSGWGGDAADEKQMSMSWMLPTLAGWCVVFNLEDHYNLLARESKESYPKVCMQLWHPDENLYESLYFAPSQFKCGASEAPLVLPPSMELWREHMLRVVDSSQKEVATASPAAKHGIMSLDVIASRHFQTPFPPFFWYQLARDNQDNQRQSTVV